MISRRSFLRATAAGAAGLLVPRRARAAVSPSDWPSHGWSPSQTRCNVVEAALGVANVARLALAWQFEAGSGITGTPAVVGDRVVVGSWDGTVTCLERVSGRVLWRFDAGRRRYPPKRLLGVFASPAIVARTVYAACDRMIALDLDTGKPRWQRTIGDPERTFEYFWAPPLPLGGRVYGGLSAGSETETRGRVVCLDAGDGRLLWQFFTTTADVGGGSLIAPPSVDPATGMLYAATGNPFHIRPGAMPWSDSLLALDAASGALRWGDQVHPHDTENLDLNCPPMLVDSAARRSIVVGGKDGIRGWDRRTRRRLWRVQLTPASPPGGGGALPTTGPEAGPTAAAGGLVFFASNDHATKSSVLAALDAATGAVRWRQKLPAFQFAPMSVANGVVYLGLVDGKLRAWRAASGELVWESPPLDPIAGGPAIASGMVFVGSGAGEFLPGNRLYAFAAG